MHMTDTATKMRPALQNALNEVVTVGSGRGFVVEDSRGHHRYIITAAHCLPFLPPCHGFSHTEERTYEDLLAPLGEAPSVWCECLFVDPVADIAVLGSPDDQALGEQAEAYEALVAAAIPLAIAEPSSQPTVQEVARLAELEKLGVRGQGPWVRLECVALLLSLSNEWFPCKVEHSPNGMLAIRDATAGIAGGMSGSPIIVEDGTAIGIVCLGDGVDRPTEGGPNPRLMGNLPGWFLNKLAPEHAATTSQYAHNPHTGGRARPSRPRRTASSTPRPLGAPRARLAWRLHSFVTSPRESCALAAPRWVPVHPVRSRGSMPALGAINGS